MYTVRDTTAVAFTCEPCASVYPIVLGIPDFRVAPDPWIDLAADRQKGERLEREHPQADVEELTRAYWRMTPDTSAASAARFTAHVIGAVSRSREWLSENGIDVVRNERWLDLGCGTADISEAAPASVSTVGVDVAFRWLVVARRRLVRLGYEPRLVCANAEALPFADNTFDRAVSLGAIEHFSDYESALREVQRTLRPLASLHLRTVNRFSLLPEPHVGILGVGYLPRKVAEWWVQRRTGSTYRHHHPRGSAELARALRGAGFESIRVEAAAPLASDRRRLERSPLRHAMALYAALRRTPLVGPCIRAIAPLLDAHADKARA